MRRRDYADRDDLIAMQRAVQRTWTPQSRWHIGDLAWRRHNIPDMEPSWRTALWEDGNTVLAWGWISLPGSLDLYVDPAHCELAAEVLAWFEATTATSSEHTVTVMETDAHLVPTLERANYHQQPRAPFFQHCVLHLDDSLATPHLRAGYRLRATRIDEATERSAAHRAAWRPSRIGEMMVPPMELGDTDSAVTTESYQTVMNTWPYRHDLDQVAEAPDGTLVASALGWFDAVNQVGELEPVGTDPRHARRGLGSAVTLSCLRALRDAGATQAVVYPRGDDAYPVARRLYLRLGFRPVARTITYCR